MTMRVRALCIGAIVAGCLGTGSIGQQGSEPIESELREKVDVRLIQLEITASSKTAACSALGKEQIELTVGGDQREIVALDLLGDYGTQAAGSFAGEPSASSLQLADRRPAAQFVLLFDEWHTRDMHCFDS